MAVVTNAGSGNDPLRVIREALGKKCFGNMMHMTAKLRDDGTFFEEAVNNLSKVLAETLVRKGLTADEKDASIHVSPDRIDPDVTTVAAKVYATWSERPIDLLVYCVQAMEDARLDAKYAKDREHETANRHTTLLRRLGKAKNMKQVQEAINADEYE